MTKARQRERLKRRKAIHGGDGRHIYRYEEEDTVKLNVPALLEFTAKVEEHLGGREFSEVSEAEREEAMAKALESSQQTGPVETWLARAAASRIE